MIETRHRFDDEQMKAFFLNGFAPLQLDLPRAFHDSVYRQTEAVFARQGDSTSFGLPGGLDRLTGAVGVNVIPSCAARWRASWGRAT